MSDLSEALRRLSNTSFEVPTGLGQGITNVASSIAPADFRRVFYDPTRDSPIGNINYTTGISARHFSGDRPFSGEGDVEYNQNIAKRAAMVAAVFGGAAAAGGAGAGAAGQAAGSAAAPTVASGAGGAGAGAGASTAAAAPAATSAPWAGPTATTATPGTTAAMYESIGATAPAAPETPGTMAAMQAGAEVPGGHFVTNVAPAAASSWLPYAQAGGAILSTLFSGLLQMERDKEENIRKLEMAQADAKVKRAQEQNQGLDRLMTVWGRGTR